MEGDSRERRPLSELGGTVRRLRQHAGLSQSELARRSHVSKATLSEIEAGHSDARFLTLVAIAGALDVPVDDLITEALSA